MVFVRTVVLLARQARGPAPTRHFCQTVSLLSAQHTERRYTRKHEWVSVDKGVGTVGISHYAQESLGEVVFVQLPAAGAALTAGDECGALESVKAAGELYSPVSGEVTEKNVAAESTPSVINESCYERGWLFRVRLSQPEELQRLMDQAQYDVYLQQQEH